MPCLIEGRWCFHSDQLIHNEWSHDSYR
jgi:hypothetical protein